MKNNRLLLYAAPWFMLGVLALIFAPGNYFFYGFFVIGMLYLIAYFYKDTKRA